MWDHSARYRFAADMSLPLKMVFARAMYPSMTLLTAPLKLGGMWGGSATSDAAAVIESMRAACLTGIDLVSDHQPEELRVDDRSGSNPAIWLHTEAPKTAWINVVVGNRDWCNLAYQFGHELGHVLCNSWERDSEPHNPCQWIEEALVEAFSLRGLRILADDWSHEPPFPDDAAYGNSIRDYRAALLAKSRNAGVDPSLGGFSAWFNSNAALLKVHGGVDAARGAVSTMLDLLEGDESAIADMGALNRWPGRTSVPLQDFLDLWEESCSELCAPGKLPVQVRALLAGT
jgi:hypothetical protein